MSNNPSPIVRRLFAEAKSRGIRVKDIGPLIKHSQSSVHYWKNDRCRPVITAVEAFADALDMELQLVPKQAIERVRKAR